MQNLTEFLESNGELKAEEMQKLSGGSDLADAATNIAISTTQGAAASGGDIMITIHGTFPGALL
jgi:hypothetical protein